MKKYLSRVLFLRRFVLPFLKSFNRDFLFKHPWTGESFKLSLFEHRGYWFHGANREISEMKAFSLLVPKGATVLEVGGHIGFMSVYFSSIVGSGGRVVVFEPCFDNFRYLKDNTFKLSNVTLYPYACSSDKGLKPFYIDNLTGQNSSLENDFSGLEANTAYAPGVEVKIQTVDVMAVKLDDFCFTNNLFPDFVKIDVEGHELSVLLGFQRLLSIPEPPILMIEIQSDHLEITRMLRVIGYVLLNAEGELLNEDFMNGLCNVFALHSRHHRAQISEFCSGRLS